MKYYKLITASEPEFIGVNNGICQAELDKDNQLTGQLSDFFSGLHYWQRGKVVPDFEINNLTATLLKKATLTDFLQFGPDLMTCPFMISERVAEVFSKFNIQKYYTYPVTLYKKEKQLPDKYYLFCCPLLGYEIIDFANSVFYRAQGIHIRHYLQFNSLEEYKAHTGLARVEKLVLNSNFNSSLDLFKARIGGMYVSEALKDALEILEFTGIHILDNYEPELVIERG